MATRSRRSDAALAVVILASAKPAARAAQTELEWARQVKRAIHHVMLVISNNPERPLTDILARPDIQQALHMPFQQAGLYTLRQVKKVWEEAAGPEPSEYLSQLYGDVTKNSILSSARMHQALTQGPRASIQGRMNRVGADLARRAGLSVRVAQVRAQTEKDLLKISQQGKQKMWVSRMDESSCSACKALHGSIRPVLVEFSHSAGERSLRVYRDLLGPPRHPNCRCRLVAVP